MDDLRSGLDRRGFLAAASGAFLTPLAAAATGGTRGVVRPRAPLFEISLAEWSLHRTLRAGTLTNLDFPRKARSFGLAAVEYVNSFFADRVGDAKYLAELRARCTAEGVRSLLIMCDGLGALGDADETKRRQAVANHRPWVDAAQALGCHSIRVNAQSQGSAEEQQKLAADGLRRLCELADPAGIDVIVENHGGLSSNGAWLAATLAAVKHPRCGSLPDFGNFRVSDTETYDRYRGIDELMPFARGVSAKSHDFDQNGDEVHTDYRRMLEVVVGTHAWRGHIGIEYEGGKLAEDDGIRATKALLERVRDELAAKLAAPKAGTAGAGKDGR
jgi:L-ribulose-5-phosphate 3-epimerase